MMDATLSIDEDLPILRDRSRGRARPLLVLAVAALAGAVVEAGWLLDASSDVATPFPVSRITPRASFSPGFNTALLDPAFSIGGQALPIDQSAPLGAELIPAAPEPLPIPEPHDRAEVPMPPAAARPSLASRDADDVPLPTPRPVEAPAAGPIRAPVHAFGRQIAQQGGKASPALPGDHSTFMEKFFGMLRPAGPALAYASPEDGLFGSSSAAITSPSVSHDRWTAVYDIAAHTVYMPNGARLEAHSGLGDRLDDPRYVNEQNRGATPPHLYELEPRAQLFHGVQALRLNPVGSGDLFGRTGLLAHTYMLGPKGDSNGCVSFKDYRTFLQAYMSGDVRRLVVVARAS